METKTPSNGQNQNKQSAVPFLTLVGIILFFYIASQFANPPSNVKIPEKTDQNLTVCTYSQIEIETKLKDPSSAKFQDCSAGSYERIEGEKYRFRSWVESNNSFGVKVRNNFSCEVRLEKDESYYINCSIY